MLGVGMFVELHNLKKAAVSLGSTFTIIKMIKYLHLT